MGKIFFISSYSLAREKYNLRNSPAADAKSAYILKKLTQIAPVKLISVTSTKEKKRRFVPLVRELAEENVENTITPSVGSKIRLIRGLNLFLPWLGLLYICLKDIKKDDIVVAYHSCMYDSLLCYMKRIKKYKLVIEAEEIYADVNGDEKSRKREMRLFNIADAYIFPTQLLDVIVNTENKPSVIAHGTYQTEMDRKCNVFCDNMQADDIKKVHCVYAGTLDPRKGGAVAAAAAAEFLPGNYHIHILGFGTEKQKKDIQDLVDDLSKRCKCGVSYDGVLSGEAYIRFIQSCDIGLSTQNPDAAFNATSFPSKVLSYMANGLRVVSIRIPVVEQSAVGDLISYYDVQTPEEIAKAIIGVDMNNPYDSRSRILDLDKQFTQDLGRMLEEITG